MIKAILSRLSRVLLREMQCFSSVTFVTALLRFAAVSVTYVTNRATREAEILSYDPVCHVCRYARVRHPENLSLSPSEGHFRDVFTRHPRFKGQT